ncbi:MAG: hypothetical protein ACOCVN_01095 [bacterium]
MILSLDFEEIAKILNHFAAEIVKENENIDFVFVPAYKGFSIKFRKFKYKFFNYTGKIKIKFIDSPGQEVVISIKLRNIFLELVKKIIFKLAYMFLKKFMKPGEEEQEEIDFSEYVFIGGTKIHLYFNGLLEHLNIPFYLRFMKVEDNYIEFDGLFRKIEK